MNSKPSRKTTGDPSTEERIDKAIDRLAAGEPTHETVKQILALGRSILTFVCLALEAGTSRTQFGHKNCRYAKQRMRLLKLQKQSRTANQVAKAARQSAGDKEEMRLRIRELETMVASQALRILELEEKYGDDGSEAARFRRKDGRKKPS